MTCTAEDVRRTMQQFSGGSDGRYRHPVQRNVIYTEGVREVALLAQAYWLIDFIAAEAAPKYANAWRAGETSIGIFKLVVEGGKATTTLSLQDGVPPALQKELPACGFPPGEWQIWLGTDPIGPDEYVTTMYLPSEH